MANFAKPPTLNDDQRAVDIYRKAAVIIRAKGFGATSMGDIAEAVDLTKGGLYYYIKGKKALLFAIMNFALELLETRVLHVGAEIPEPRERLAQMLSGHLRLMLDEPAAMIVLSDELDGLTPVHLDRVMERKRRYSSVLESTVTELMDAEQTSDRVASEVATGSLLSIIEGVVRWYDPRTSRFNKDEVVAQIVRMALRGLGPAGPSRS